MQMIFLWDVKIEHTYLRSNQLEYLLGKHGLQLTRLHHLFDDVETANQLTCGILELVQLDHYATFTGKPQTNDSVVDLPSTAGGKSAS